MPVISRATIETIHDAARIEEVIGEFVVLKKRGANLIGLCPFHDEKTPSFVVSPAKGIYKCFGCSKSGDAVKFVMEHETYSYPQALKYLAEKYKIPIEETEVSDEEKQTADRKDSLYIVLKYAMEYFQDQLFNTDEGKSVGLSYFKSRGFREDTIREFGLGYSPEGWDHFYQAAVSAGHNPDLLEQAGLIKRREDKTFDFFRGRVMFPIFNVTGKPVAFGGRILKKNEKSPKYINTPETEVYIKSRLVYGIFQAKQEIRKLDETLLVEGYTDVISLHQAGIRHAVASSGTALTPDQVRLIRRFSPNITLLFDGDKAGIKAAIRGVDILLEQDADVRVIILPDGEDPDSYLHRVGSEAFEEYLRKNKRDFVLFKLALLLEEGGNDPIRKSAVIREIAQSIALIKDAIKRSVYTKECSSLLEIDEKLLVVETNKQRRKLLGDRRSGEGTAPRQTGSLEELPEESAGTQQPRPKEDPYTVLEREIVRLLLLYGHEQVGEMTGAAQIFSILGDQEFNDAAYNVILNTYRQTHLAGGDLNLSQDFRASDQEEIRDVCCDILAPGYELSENWFKRHQVVVSSQDADLGRNLRETAMRYRSRRFLDTLRLLDERLRDEPDYQTQLDLLKYRRKFEQEKNELHQQLGTDVIR